MDNIVILNEDHIVEAISRYLRDTPFKLEFDYLEIVDLIDTEDGSLKLELELFDEM